MKKRFRNAMMLGLLTGSLAFTACGENKKENEEVSKPMQNEMHQPKEETAKQSEKTASAEFKDENTGKIYKQYAQIKDALVEGNAGDAQESAKELAELLNKNGEKAEVSGAAQKLADTEDINQQREAFSELTAAMEPVLKGALASGEIYKQFCPMAFEGKGDYWYSDTKEIYNPYFGDKMLHCGRTEVTIK